MNTSVRAATITAVTAAAAVLGGCGPADSPGPPSSVAWEKAPAKYRTAIEGALAEYGCEGVTRDVIAAQIYTASKFKAVQSQSGIGSGPAQLPLPLWNQYAPKVEATDINNPTDSTKVLVLFNCDTAKALTAANTATSVDNMMTAYVAGIDAVLKPNPRLQDTIESNVAPLLEAARTA